MPARHPVLREMSITLPQKQSLDCTTSSVFLYFSRQTHPRRSLSLELRTINGFQATRFISLQGHLWASLCALGHPCLFLGSECVLGAFWRFLRRFQGLSSTSPRATPPAFATLSPLKHPRPLRWLPHPGGLYLVCEMTLGEGPLHCSSGSGHRSAAPTMTTMKSAR